MLELQPLGSLFVIAMYPANDRLRMSLDKAGNLRGSLLLLGQRMERRVPLPRPRVCVPDRCYPQIFCGLIPFCRVHCQHEDAAASLVAFENRDQAPLQSFDSTSFKKLRFSLWAWFKLWITLVSY